MGVDPIEWRRPPGQGLIGVKRGHVGSMSEQRDGREEITEGQVAGGITIAAAIRELIPETSWSRARQLCQAGAVMVNGETFTDPSRRVPDANRIRIVPMEGRRARRTLPDAALLYVDHAIVVVAKPAGMETVPYRPDRDAFSQRRISDRDTLIGATRVALRRYEKKRGIEGSPVLQVVQRLDKETSGVLVFTRNITAQRILQQQFRKHSVEREYLALVHGHAKDARYETNLIPNRGDGLRGSWGVFRRARGPMPETAKPAITHVRLVRHLQGASLVACKLETGRQHQIRIHLSEAGHPLIGEKVYIRDYTGARIDADRPMLHAGKLGFLHPANQRPISFEQPIPEDFALILQKLEG